MSTTLTVDGLVKEYLANPGRMRGRLVDIR
jgi:hypothetical protein